MASSMTSTLSCRDTLQALVSFFESPELHLCLALPSGGLRLWIQSAVGHQGPLLSLFVVLAGDGTWGSVHASTLDKQCTTESPPPPHGGLVPRSVPCMLVLIPHRSHAMRNRSVGNSSGPYEMPPRPPTRPATRHPPEEVKGEGLRTHGGVRCRCRMGMGPP